MQIEVLGAFGSKGEKGNNTCFKISKHTVIDAGNLIAPLKKKANMIENIFLTHAHLDHIEDIPFFIDSFFEQRETPIEIFGLKETLKDLENYIFNWRIWPDFRNIELLNKKHKALIFNEIELFNPVEIDGIKIEAVPANHTITTVGYIINDRVLISGDTYLNETIIKILNERKIENIIFDVSFPSRLDILAKSSKHLTPKLFKKIILQLDYKPKTFIYHIKPSYFWEIQKEVEKDEILKNAIILQDTMLLDFENNRFKKPKDLVENLLFMSKALSYEQNLDKILENVVGFARNITNSDAATLYIKSSDDKFLNFKVVENETLNVFMGGTKEKITWPPLPLYKESGEENKEMVAVLCALTGNVINIEDVYTAKNFNFEGTKKFDSFTGYRSKSMLVVPLKNHENEIVGVLQLINKIDDANIVAYSKSDEEIVLSLASIAAVSLTKNELIKDFELLLESLIKTIGFASLRNNF